MSHLVITKVASKNYYKIESNDSDFKWDYDFLWAENIRDVKKNGAVELIFYDGTVWDLSIDGSDGTIEVDTIDGVAQRRPR